MTAKGRLIRNTVIAVAAVAVLGGGYYFAQNWTPDSDKESKAEDTKTETKAELVYILSEDSENISSVHIKNPNAEYDIIKTKDGDSDTYTIPGMPEAELNKLSLSSAVTSLSKPAASKTITKDVSKAAEFGISDDSTQYTLKKNSGDTVTVLLGDKVPTGGSYYIMVRGGDTIYTVGESIANMILRVPSDYRNTTLMSLSNAADIKEFTLYNDSGLVMKVRSTTEEENKSKMLGTSWSMEYPWNNVDVSDTNLQGAFEKLLKIEAKGFTGDGESPGFDYKFEINTEKESYSFSVGNEASEGLVYIKNNKTSQIYTTDRSIRDALAAMNPSEYISKLIYIKNIKDVDTVKVRYGDKSYELKTGEEDKGGWLINGNETTEKDFKSKYQTVIGVMFKEIAEGYKPSGEPHMTVTFKMKDGSESSVKYYNYSEREYAAVTPDGLSVTVLKSELDKVEKLF